MKLIDIATIASGVNQKKHPHGDVFYLQARDFLEDHFLDPELKPCIVNSQTIMKHLLYKGDVLVSSKGHNGFNAFAYNADKKPAVASSIFLVLRDIKSTVLPNYIAWYLNLESTQNHLIKTSRGTALPAINKAILAELDIPIVSLIDQEKIVALSQLKNKESGIVKSLDLLKSKQLEIQLKKYINKL